MKLTIRSIGMQPYQPCYEAMRDYTRTRSSDTSDELWLLQHPPVFTQGRAGKPEYILDSGDIPIVQIDRGGQVTYHGPGQLTGYLLIDIKRLSVGVREFVTIIEQAIVATLAHWGVDSAPRADAPGVYVGDAKIGALGLRVSKGCTYHGLNFNLDMDMSPWSRINPCGLGVPVTQMKDLIDRMPSDEEIERYLSKQLANGLGYNDISNTNDLPPALIKALS